MKCKGSNFVRLGPRFIPDFRHAPSLAMCSETKQIVKVETKFFDNYNVCQYVDLV